MALPEGLDPMFRLTPEHTAQVMKDIESGKIVPSVPSSPKEQVAE